MNPPPEKILSVLEPPPGGLARLRSRRDSRVPRAQPWWALVAGAATAAVVWIAILPGPTEIRMQLTGSRLVGARSQGVRRLIYLSRGNWSNPQAALRNLSSQFSATSKPNRPRLATNAICSKTSVNRSAYSVLTFQGVQPAP